MPRRSNKDEFLRNFRSGHHYNSKLKYWSEYKQTFEYLDSKAQGLLAAAAIMAAIFLLALESLLKPEIQFAEISYNVISLLISGAGLVFVIVAAILLMRCFYSNADKFIPDKSKLVADFESVFGIADEALLEAEIDAFIALYTKHAFAIQNFQGGIEVSEKKKCCAELIHYCLRLNHSQNEPPSVDDIMKWDSARFWHQRNELKKYRLLKNRADSLFKGLRYSVEQEINCRRLRYMYARLLVLVSLWMLLVAVFFMFLGHL